MTDLFRGYALTEWPLPFAWRAIRAGVTVSQTGSDGAGPVFRQTVSIGPATFVRLRAGEAATRRRALSLARAEAKRRIAHADFAAGGEYDLAISVLN